jgi:hypothetical protein
MVDMTQGPPNYGSGYLQVEGGPRYTLNNSGAITHSGPNVPMGGNLQSTYPTSPSGVPPVSVPQQPGMQNFVGQNFGTQNPGTQNSGTKLSPSTQLWQQMQQRMMPAFPRAPQAPQGFNYTQPSSSMFNWLVR